MIGSGGGSLEVMGAIVQIPPNALDTDEEIQLTSYYGNLKQSVCQTKIFKISLSMCFAIANKQHLLGLDNKRWLWKGVLHNFINAVVSCADYGFGGSY